MSDRGIPLAAWIFVLVFAWTFAGVSPAGAQAGAEVTLKAQAGFDGYCKEGNWIPLRVTMQNSGPDLDVRVQASFRNTSPGNMSVNAADLALPAASRKEITLYAYPQGFLSTFNISLLADGRELIKTDLKVNCLARENLLFGLITDNPSAFLPLNEIQTATGIVRVARLEIADLPDRTQGLGALDAILVSGVDTGTLTAGQRQALKLWLAEGGKLLVLGGPKWQATVSGLNELMPVNLNATRTVSGFSQLEEYVGSSAVLEGEAVLGVGELRARSEVVIEQGGFPLIAQSEVGFGRVIYFAADPGLQPLSDWTGMQDVYAKLVGTRPLRPVWLTSQWDDYNANRALSTLNELGIPSIFFICGWLALYVALIGPVNYLVLNRLKRRELAWLTIPGLVVVFAGLAYFSGFAYRGTRPILNRLAVVQAWDQLDQARANAVVGLYSPTRTNYTVDSGSQFMLYPFGGTNVSLQSENSWFALQQGLAMFVPDVLVEIGGLEAVSAQGYLSPLEVTHDLVIAVDDRSPMLTGNITNASPYILKDAILVTPGGWKRLGDLVPGAAHNADLSLIPGPNGPEFYNLTASMLLGVDYFGDQASEEDLRRVALMSAVMTSNYGLKEPNWGIYLIGWLDEPLTSIGLRDREFESIDTVLYIDQLSPGSEMTAAELKLPPSLFIWETSSPGSTPYYSNGIPVGGYILRFRPAVPIQFRAVKSLSVNMSSNANPADVFVSLWNFEQEAWTSVDDLVWGENQIPDAGRFVARDGEIRLRVDGNQNSYIEMQASNVTLVVEP